MRRFVLLCCLGLLVAACGDDADGVPPPTLPEFVTEKCDTWELTPDPLEYIEFIREVQQAGLELDEVIEAMTDQCPDVFENPAFLEAVERAGAPGEG